MSAMIDLSDALCQFIFWATEVERLGKVRASWDYQQAKREKAQAEERLRQVHFSLMDEWAAMKAAAEAHGQEVA